MNKTDKEPIKSFCDNCQGYTNHDILFDKTIQRYEDEDYYYGLKYLTIQCRGCENIVFRSEMHDYESAYPDDLNNWTYDIAVNTYPQPLKNYRAIKEPHLLPTQIKIVYKETLDALRSNSFLLAGVGFRAVVEAICIDKEIAGRNLELKIDSLSKNRYITDKEAERLHAVRFMGNDSVHEMAVPTERALYVVLEIIEHLLNNLYIIDQHAKPVLDIYITNQEEFEALLIKKVRPFKKGDDFPLAKFLGRDIRRLNGKISQFELELVKNIQLGEFTILTIGDIKVFGDSANKLQHFVKA